MIGGPAVGAEVGAWRLERALGQGAMGAVFAARHATTGAVRAVKVMTRALDARGRERFAREGRALARLGPHPHIVGVHELGESRWGPFLVLDLVEGRPLASVLERGPLPRAQALTLCRRLAEALAACHAAGVVHRDLKPDNVLVRPDGAPVLVDFGIARDEAEERMTKTGAIVGTPAWMAPEQLTPSKAHPVGPWTDVFSLGAVCYQVLTGQQPFAGEHYLQIVKAVCMDPIAPPSRGRPALASAPDAAALDGVVLAALTRDAARRPSAAAVAQAFAALEAGRAPALAPPTGERPGRGALAAALAGGLLLGGAAAVALVVAALGGAPEAPARAPGPAPAAEATGPADAAGALAAPAADPRRWAHAPDAPLRYAFRMEYRTEDGSWLDLVVGLRFAPGPGPAGGARLDARFLEIKIESGNETLDATFRYATQGKVCTDPRLSVYDHFVGRDFVVALSDTGRVLAVERTDPIVAAAEADLERLAEGAPMPGATNAVRVSLRDLSDAGLARLFAPLFGVLPATPPGRSPTARWSDEVVVTPGVLQSLGAHRCPVAWQAEVGPESVRTAAAGAREEGALRVRVEGRARFGAGRLVSSTWTEELAVQGNNGMRRVTSLSLVEGGP